LWKDNNRDDSELYSNIKTVQFSTMMADGSDQSAAVAEVISLLPAELCVDGNQNADEEMPATNELGETSASTTGIVTGGMSKNARKKLFKKQLWAAGKEDRKAKKKEQKKASKIRQREAKERGEVTQVVRQRPLVQTPVSITLVLDCSFESFMTDKELTSLTGQIQKSYHDTRSGKYRPLLAVTSFGGMMKERFDTVLMGHYKNWKGVHFVEDDISKIGELATSWMRGIKVIDFATDSEDTRVDNGLESAVDGSTNEESRDAGSARVVYLSADSPDVLTTLEQNTCYIIGGLVDRNRHKGICFEAARKAGIPTARLPIGEFINMSSRQVLTTNHVVEIMVKYLETQNWEQSFLEVIPMRKGAGLKSLEVDEEEIEEGAEAKGAQDEQNGSEDLESPR